MSKYRYTLDTNLLIYAVDNKAEHQDKRIQAIKLLDEAVDQAVVLTVQALAEFYFATTRKNKLSLMEAEQQAADWEILFPVIAADARDLNQAMLLARQHSLSFWDALLLSTAQRHGVKFLLSEDFQDGWKYKGIQVINPFTCKTRWQ